MNNNMVPKIELSKDGRRQAIRYAWAKWWTETYFVFDRYERKTKDDEIQCDYKVITTFKTEREASDCLEDIHSRFGYYEKIT